MSPEELENWKKVKERLEKEELTSCMFYKRASIIVAGGKDPMVLPSLDDD